VFLPELSWADKTVGEPLDPGKGRSLACSLHSLKAGFDHRAFGKSLFLLDPDIDFILPYSGIVARFPLLSGAVASTLFLAASFSTLAICLVPALRWQYGSSGVSIATPGLGTRSRALQGEKRTRKRSLKRSGSVSHVKLEVGLACSNPGFIHDCFPTHARITRVSLHFPQPRRCPMHYAVAVLWYRTRFPKVIEMFPSH
jgi:hypothetical protein